MRRVGTYLLCACCACTVCTIIVVLSCSCEQSASPIAYRASRISQVNADERRATLPKTYLVIVIMTHANDSAVRAIIRDTWLKLSSKGPSVFRHVFPMGIRNLSKRALELLNEEQNLYGDLLLLDDLIDEYSNLARKTLMVFDTVCQMFNFEFVLKVDSDSFVRLGALLKALKDIAHPRLYWGFLDGRAKPRRRGQWAEREWVLCDRYLPYQLGGGYVLSYKLADYISRNKDLLKLYRSEDVSVGAWLAGLDVRYVHDPRFDTEFRSRGCHLCVEEYRTRWSYVYDWSVPPSMCCARHNNSDIP
ncbi:unnamed protein product [Toxocara canis]|uniref:Hexosyltransferase n=1 Tax=Toxocara canis TaxID=6265 RepID=A0A183V5W2_TOXCA|nr:unnamed protein product [Toxocara canis]